MQEHLAVGYHQQDTNYYCGGACAQMVLDSIGAGLLGQDGLYADNHSHSLLDPAVNWATAPDGLEWTMNDRRPASFTNYFVTYALSTEDALSRKLVWTIHHYQVAPIALVFGWDHWIVVRGYDASAAPADYSDTSYSINSFDVNNPWPPTPVPGPPPPHSAGDVCGGGGPRGVANEHISYGTWQSTYMTGVPSNYWAGKFVAVCDPDPPPSGYGQRRRPSERREDDTLIGPEQAIEGALSGLQSYGLYDREDWIGPLRQAKPGQPLLVERLDHPNTYYYLVPMGSEDDELAVAVGVDARHGGYLQASALPEPGPNFLRALAGREVLRALEGRTVELPDRQGRIVVHPERVCLYPLLVWKPCLESLSPLYPFRMITVGSHRLYVRSDGEVFSELHDAEAGI